MGYYSRLLAIFSTLSGGTSSAPAAPTRSIQGGFFMDLHALGQHVGGDDVVVVLGKMNRGAERAGNQFMIGH